MKRIITTVALLFTIIHVRSADNIETFNVISDSYVNEVKDAKLIREINGGSVIIPEFDESCPEEMKTPFAYACKIVEEYIPPCLPLKVKVSCGRINGASNNSISKVVIRSYKDFGDNSPYGNSPMSQIKALTLAELEVNGSVTYLGSIPNVAFLTDNPDIEIIYNERRLEEISFSLKSEPEQNYDFVSLAIRDIMIGLGITSSYRYNPVTQGLEDPVNNKTPFECQIDEKLGYRETPQAKLANATKGELVLNGGLRLYAPTTWQNGISLNYLVPDDYFSVSRILSYDFCRGMVLRDLSDGHSEYIFNDLLGWEPDLVVSIEGTASTGAGSTEVKLPYNGAISFEEDNPYFIRKYIESVPASKIRKSEIQNYDERLELMNYVESFHPMNYDSDAVSLSILKKDGTWDRVFFLEVYFPGMPLEIKMSDCEFHFDEDIYARTIDGYLRARYTTKFTDNNRKTTISSTFFVVDYLPQKVNLSYKLGEKVQPVTTLGVEPNAISSYPVRLYFSNLEGINRIVLERVRKGFRMPSKIEVTDFKKGYFDTTIDRETTFTAIGYNENGSSKGLPVTITPLESETVVNFKILDEKILVQYPLMSETEYEYSITSIDRITCQPELSGVSSGMIDISELCDGIYLLYVQNKETGESGTFKFKK